MLWIKLVVVQGSVLVCLASLKYRTTQVCLGASTATSGLEPVGLHFCAAEPKLVANFFLASRRCIFPAGLGY